MEGPTQMKRFHSYPPAETKIPLSALLAAILPKSPDFKNALCRYIGVRNCVLANSGRALLYRLLSVTKALHPERDEVLIPGYTCYSVAASVARAGLSIRPYDLDPKTLSPDMSFLEQAASNRTLAILVQHLFGIPTVLNEIRPIAKKVGAILIEDAAQALGGSLNGSLLGTEGDYGLFSFGRGKPLPLGSGGALIAKDQNMPPAMQLDGRSSGFLRYAVSTAAQLLSNPYFYGFAEMLPIGLGETVFNPKFNVSSIEPMIEKLGHNSLEYLPKLNNHRTRIARVYLNTLHADVSIPSPKNAKPVYTRFPVLGEPVPISRELRSFGVRRMYPKAMVEEKTITPFLSNHWADTPGAAQIAQKLITLPTHMQITEELARQIAGRVNRSCS